MDILKGAAELATDAYNKYSGGYKCDEGHGHISQDDADKCDRDTKRKMEESAKLEKEIQTLQRELKNISKCCVIS